MVLEQPPFIPLFMPEPSDPRPNSRLMDGGLSSYRVIVSSQLALRAAPFLDPFVVQRGSDLQSGAKPPASGYSGLALIGTRNPHYTDIV
jgi:hypothetical protein